WRTCAQALAKASAAPRPSPRQIGLASCRRWTPRWHGWSAHSAAEPPALSCADSPQQEEPYMVARAYWQGQIRLALVSIQVEITAATKSVAAISFRQIHEPSGKPINYEKVVQGIGPVDRDEIVRGFEVAKGSYVLLGDDEIEAAKVESRRTLELVQ